MIFCHCHFQLLNFTQVNFHWKKNVFHTHENAICLSIWMPLNAILTFKFFLKGYAVVWQRLLIWKKDTWTDYELMFCRLLKGFTLKKQKPEHCIQYSFMMILVVDMDRCFCYDRGWANCEKTEEKTEEKHFQEESRICVSHSSCCMNRYKHL